MFQVKAAANARIALTSERQNFTKDATYEVVVASNRTIIL